MEFSEREKNRTKDMWNQSGAILKESSAKVSEKKVPKEYRGHADGERKKTVPSELRRLEHAYGSISIGINQKEQMVVLMNRKTGFREEGLTEAQKGLNIERAHREPEGNGRCYMDSFCGKKGAFAWEESKMDSPEKIWKQLRAIPGREGLEIADGLIGNEARQIPEGKREELFRKIRRNLKEAVSEARRETKEAKAEFQSKSLYRGDLAYESEDGVEEQADGENEEADLYIK